jgi:hypothetical protein
MPLTADDIKFFAAANNTDTPDAGGPRSATIVQNGVLNNLFPPVSAGDRTTGRTSIRKIYPSLTNADSAPLLGARSGLNELPTDAAVSLVMWATGNASTTRAQAIAGLYTLHSGSMSRLWRAVGGAASNPGGATLYAAAFQVGAPLVGERIAVFPSGQEGNWAVAHRCVVESVSGVFLGSPYLFSTAVDNYIEVGVNPPVPFTWARMAGNASAVTTSPAYGATSTTAGAASAATVLAVASLQAQLVPFAGSGAYPTADLGIPPQQLQYADGKVPILRIGDAVCISDEQAMAAASVTTGQVVSTGRTGLDQAAVVGADGIEIGRVFVGGPASPALSCNFSTGAVTIGDVTGWPQPVTVRHRIAHRAMVSGISGLNLTITPALPVAFPSGSVVASELPHGDIAAAVSVSFSQQAWTRQWQSTLIGNPAAAMYSGLPTLTNQGAESDRYAIVFSDAASFTAYSERLGLLGTGTTAANFSPLNSATGAPLFTLLSANWAPAIVVGSTMRFDTVGAAPPVWMARCVRPSTATGATRAVLRLHGSV